MPGAAPVLEPQGESSSDGEEPIPHWPGRLVAAGKRELFVRTVVAAGASVSAGGEPVLCVHGLAGSATNWTDLMAELRPEFSAAAVDLPGFGYSPPPQNSAGYSITAQASAVAELIEASGEPVHLVGNSLGGAVCIRLAARWPELVSTLTLISPLLPDRRPRPSLVRFPVLCLPGAGDWLLRRVGAIEAERRVEATLAGVYYNRLLVRPARFTAEADELRRRDTLPYADEALICSTRSVVAENFRGALWRDAAQIGVPVLAIFGSHDRLIDPRLAGRAARTFGDARVVVLPQTGHVAHLEHPARVAAEIRNLGMRRQGSELTPLQT